MPTAGGIAQPIAWEKVHHGGVMATRKGEANPSDTTGPIPSPTMPKHAATQMEHTSAAWYSSGGGGVNQAANEK